MLLYFFILGLIFGSFFNVVGLRIPNGQSIVFPGSHCPNCQKTLSSVELIPVFSYLLQKGKCRNCHTKISPIYPSFELLTGMLFAFSYFYFGFTFELLVGLTLISLLMIIVVSDFKHMIIPDKVLLFFVPLFIVERTFIPLGPWWNPLLGAIAGFGLLLLIAIISKGGMGGGDIKLFAVLGIVLGWKLVLFAFFMSTLFGTVFGLIGMLLKKVERGKPMPFGPYIALGTLVAYFYGENLIGWYSMNFLTLL
ncbi:prepilin signal peptidase PulO-like peptidase [Schinkia azotoformans MEV2011]|uniref:Prepilin signal peptidase PulO-like peptidase n=1 Tax=Schinkia azotoformans MEV2011 TaxID=1348973 RepID=A0A072P1T1_SCHAZ|nr:A24 family peptidase [Schinkia azotoformans]KEF39450.1 prepilin signal peptidase PulO-like peptidase [Schinkia azotoformans MEV2011]MEC1696834.1 prepilin peptidase [Schinkia azotoformans]MEC1726633.1 prepilin peptidase [Schinkia azotoformans]MEC1780590.1 prepilin peptidase [Schinkia azotoformans]MED4331265.1 prepilin peptidase [Schinkia azotoformans]